MLSKLGSKTITIHAFTYTLNELCSDKELLILQSHCINKKQQLFANEKIEEYIEKFIKVKCSYYDIKYSSQQEVALAFGKDTITETIDKIKEYVQTYLNNTSPNNSTQFHNIIITITNKYTARSPFYMLQRCCEPNELLQIQYLCLMAKQLKESNVSIMSRLNEIVKLKHDFYCSRHDLESEQLTDLILKNEIDNFYNSIKIKSLTVNMNYYESSNTLTDNDVSAYFDKINSTFDRVKTSKSFFLNFDIVAQNVLYSINSTKKNLENGYVDCISYSYESLFEDYTTDLSFSSPPSHRYVS